MNRFLSGMVAIAPRLRFAMIANMDGGPAEKRACRKDRRNHCVFRLARFSRK